VKTTNGSARTPFFLTRNECGLAAERPVDWRIYRVHLFAKEPRIFVSRAPAERSRQSQPGNLESVFLRFGRLSFEFVMPPRRRVSCRP
jgi:hypothetical protein